MEIRYKVNVGNRAFYRKLVFVCLIIVAILASFKIAMYVTFVSGGELAGFVLLFLLGAIFLFVQDFWEKL